MVRPHLRGARPIPSLDTRESAGTVDITIVGSGYVGLVTGACLAELGHTVVCLDTDASRIAELRAGHVPVFEPGLDELIGRNVEEHRISFSTNYEESMSGSTVIIIAVGTPSLSTGAADLSGVETAFRMLAPHVNSGSTIVVKSTVPVGANRQMQELFQQLAPDKDVSFASNPEFLKQGAAVADFLYPDRIVVGTADERAERTLRELYEPLLARDVTIVFTDLATSELVKYASNAFLAVKLSFINEIADLCDQTGATIDDVAFGMGLDTRISPSFLNAGPGYGGSCFPKDTEALLHTGNVHGSPSRIVAAAVDVNRNRRASMVERIVRHLGGDVNGTKIGVLGITYKANTDDLRESPAVEIVRGLVGHGAEISIYDPQGMPDAASVVTGVSYATDAYAAIDGAAAAVILTEWPEFGSLNLAHVKTLLAAPLIIDLRNMYATEDMQAAAIEYHSIGRPSSVARQAAM
jgi:UDPglucose 6-dehydrogenase